MSVDDTATRKKNRYHFDRHTPEYRLQFEKITEEMHAKCPMAWTETYDGHWVAAGSKRGLRTRPMPRRCPTTTTSPAKAPATRASRIPDAEPRQVVRGGILEMDEPEHSTLPAVHSTRTCRPRPSSAGCRSSTRSCGPALDEKIESGHIDFVDDLANIVPAVLTLAMMGIPLKKWTIYSEPAHASVYTPEHSPEPPSASTPCTARWASTCSPTCSRSARTPGRAW